MPLRDQISNDLKEAMRAGDTRKRDAIRLLTAALKQKEVDERKTLADADVVAIIDKMLKQRRDSIEQFEKGGRPELAAKEKDELAILHTYLPQAMSAEDLATAVREAIAEVGATTRAQMGAVMKVLQAKIAGRADGKTLSQEVQRQLQ